MALKPLHDRVLVRRIEGEEKTKGGLIIPDNAKEKPIEGEVIAVGPGAFNTSGTRLPMSVEVGDRVLVGKWGGTEVPFEGKELLSIKDSDIIAIVS
jgi:chaperonin GroES